MDSLRCAFCASVDFAADFVGAEQQEVGFV
jgi:hypothetical protein